MSVISWICHILNMQNANVNFLKALLTPVSVKVFYSLGWVAKRIFTTFWSSIYERFKENSKTKIKKMVHMLLLQSNSPANIYMFKVNNRNTTKRCEICPKLTIKTPEQRQLCHSGVLIVNI